MGSVTWTDVLQWHQGRDGVYRASSHAFLRRCVIGWLLGGVW